MKRFLRFAIVFCFIVSVGFTAWNVFGCETHFVSTCAVTEAGRAGNLCLYQVTCSTPDGGSATTTFSCECGGEGGEGQGPVNPLQ